MTNAAVRVLICEDEAIIRIWLKRELSRQGYQVVGEAQTGRQAVRQALELRPDLILMDIRMPDGDGVEASEEILRHLPTPIVILTAYGQPEMVQRALDAGVAGYLVKPIEPSQLQPAISLARARFAELMALRTRVESMTEALEHRKTLDRAKGILIRKLGIDEPAAHQMLQRISSQQRLPLHEVARQVIERGLSLD